MTTSNITELHPAANQAVPTIDSVLQTLTRWRQNKRSSREKIPDAIWHDIFALEEIHSSSKLRALFSISGTQYNNATARLKSDAQENISDVPPQSVDFCQAKPVIPEYRPLKKLATHTVIVEFCRADGQIMKIHTTTDSFKELITTFLGKSI